MSIYWQYEENQQSIGNKANLTAFNRASAVITKRYLTKLDTDMTSARWNVLSAVDTLATHHIISGKGD